MGVGVGWRINPEKSLDRGRGSNGLHVRGGGHNQRAQRRAVAVAVSGGGEFFGSTSLARMGVGGAAPGTAEAGVVSFLAAARLSPRNTRRYPLRSFADITRIFVPSQRSRRSSGFHFDSACLPQPPPGLRRRWRTDDAVAAAAQRATTSTATAEKFRTRRKGEPQSQRATEPRSCPPLSRAASALQQAARGRVQFDGRTGFLAPAFGPGAERCANIAFVRHDVTSVGRSFGQFSWEKMLRARTSEPVKAFAEAGTDGFGIQFQDAARFPRGRDRRK